MMQSSNTNQTTNSPSLAKPARISVAEAKDALERSGYLLEHRVENFLRKRRWYVEANTAYQDPDTHKSRELDIFGLRSLKFSKEPGESLWGAVYAECVNNAQPMAFITKEDKFSLFFQSDIKLVFNPREIFDEVQTEVDAVEFLHLADFHHYCYGRVATQFCSFARKDREKGEWMAVHDNAHFDCFMTLIKAVEYQMGVSPYVEEPDLCGQFFYPLLILQGDLLDVRLVGEDVDVEVVDHIKYRRSVIWNEVETGYIIDVVTEKGLPEFFDKLEKELDKIALGVEVKRDALRATLKQRCISQKSAATAKF